MKMKAEVRIIYCWKKNTKDCQKSLEVGQGQKRPQVGSFGSSIAVVKPGLGFLAVTAEL